MSTTTEQGVQFVEVDGRRSSQRAGTAILADAVRAVDERLAHRIETATDWRKKYMEPFGAVVAAGARSSKDALRIAADGLDSARRNVSFVRDGNESSLGEALSTSAATPYATETVEGTGARVTELTVPYRGRDLRGEELLDQVRLWEERGILEPSCATRLARVVENPDWLDLSDRYFALLGAASEMGPLEPLASWGANVLAVDLPRPALWRHIVATAKAGSGTLHVAVKPGGGPIEKRAGADLLLETPEIKTWLASFDQPYTIGNYVYADGATFLRLAAAVDALIADLLEAKPGLSLAYLATPTDVFAIHEDIAQSAHGRARGPLRAGLRGISAGRLYARNYDDMVDGEGGRRWGVSNALVPIQGPNYALAKALQRWRAIVAREEGVISSATVAPASRTKSVVKNKLLAAAYRGAPSFGLEIFEPQTAKVLTAALLVHDLRDPASGANPDAGLGHPYDLFVEGALHGGMWRLPYEARSVLPLALLRGMAKRS
jgi:hypothetical protein